MTGVPMLNDISASSHSGVPVRPVGDAQLQVSLAVTPALDGGAQAVIVASGEIDIATVELLRAAALGLAAAAAADRGGSAVHLVLDWEAVSFLDCSGVRLLLDLHARGIEQGWSLRWIPPSAPGPARLLRLAAEQGWLPLPLVHRVSARPRSVQLAGGRSG
jgi:anti-anti-sigma factor